MTTNLIKRVGAVLAVAITLTVAAGPATATTYMLTDHHGGTWADADKTVANTEDDLMCWAAAASNVLEWTGWGKTAGMTNTDQMFTYFQDHWTDQGGNMVYGWDWWFDGTNDSQGWSGWSQVDVAGGGFYPSLTFADYHHYQGSDGLAMATIDAYLQAGYGTALAITGPTGHAVTCWGFDYDPEDPDYYTGIWLTDSDDYTDALQHYDVTLSGGAWSLSGYLSGYAISEVHGLEQIIPEPVTLAGLFLGLGALGGYVRRRR